MRVDFARFFVSLPKEVVELAERESAFRDFGVKSVDAFDAIRQKLLNTVLAAGLSCNGEEDASEIILKTTTVTIIATRPDTRPIPVADGWAGAEMRVFALSKLDDLYGPTDRPTDGQSLL